MREKIKQKSNIDNEGGRKAVERTSKVNHKPKEKAQREPLGKENKVKTQNDSLGRGQREKVTKGSSMKGKTEKFQKDFLGKAKKESINNGKHEKLQKVNLEKEKIENLNQESLKKDKKEKINREPLLKMRKNRPDNKSEERTIEKPTKSKKTNMNSKKDDGKALKIIPLGGLKEIGKNMTAFEYGDEIIVVDCGLSFPEDEMLGIDIVIPDFDYLIQNAKKVKGVIITHGHEDHIGGTPYLLKELKVPIYGTRLPIALIEGKLEEHKIKGKTKVINAGDVFQLGPFKVTAIRTTHSIADSLAFAIETPVGTILHTGDFKIDYTPVDGEPIDLRTFARIGEKGVLLMLADSTNAARPGYTSSEKVVGKALGDIFRDTNSRILVATFSSNVHRIQKIIDNAVKCGRKVAFSGRSMVKVATVATELGYLEFPPGTLVDMNRVNNYPDNELVIVTTGSQGEPMAALSRMASRTHRDVQIKKGDIVVLSSTPVPGNEKTVYNVVNNLIENGAKVIYSDIAETHVSGHACAEELKVIHTLVKPKYFMPVHGEGLHLKKHQELAIDLGMKEENTFILDNGDMLSITKKSATINKNAARSETIMVDGLGVGDIGSVVLKDRKLLSESGLIVVTISLDGSTGEVVAGPEIISRGFVYVKENEHLIEEAKEIANLTLDKCKAEKVKDWATMKTRIREDMRRFIYDRTKRNPVILSIFMEV